MQQPFSLYFPLAWILEGLLAGAADFHSRKPSETSVLAMPTARAKILDTLRLYWGSLKIRTTKHFKASWWSPRNSNSSSELKQQVWRRKIHRQTGNYHRHLIYPLRIHNKNQGLLGSLAECWYCSFHAGRRAAPNNQTYRIGCNMEEIWIWWSLDPSQSYNQRYVHFSSQDHGYFTHWSCASFAGMENRVTIIDGMGRVVIFLRFQIEEVWYHTALSSRLSKNYQPAPKTSIQGT